MRLIMIGTGPFALPTFRLLADGPDDVLALVTQPVRTSGARAPAPSPLRAIAEERSIEIFDPEDINTAESIERLALGKPELLVVADYGQILSSAALASAPLGGINLHGSLLPKYRGAAPINWALFNGDPVTGVTVIHMTPRVDAGPAIAQRSTEIDPDEDAVALEHRLAELGAPLIVEVIESLARGERRAIDQDPKLASPARRLRKSDGQIDWSRPALAIKNQVRALEPWPRTVTFWHPAGRPPLRLILGQTSVVEPGTDSHVPGSVIVATGDRLEIATGQGNLAIRTLQPAGKRMLTTAEFLRGYPVQPGDRFGPESFG